MSTENWGDHDEDNNYVVDTYDDYESKPVILKRRHYFTCCKMTQFAKCKSWGKCSQCGFMAMKSCIRSKIVNINEEY